MIIIGKFKIINKKFIKLMSKVHSLDLEICNLEKTNEILKDEQQ